MARRYTRARCPLYGPGPPPWRASFIGIGDMAANAHDSIWGPAKGQELAIQLQELLDSRSGYRDTIANALTLVQEHTEFEVVGVRLREGDDYPYYVTSGLSAGLCEAERSLCVSKRGEEIARSETGAPISECFCGAVLSGQVDPSQAWFTAAGSFWSNNAARAASSMPADATPPGFCGRCFQDRYESFALIPLRCDQEIVGVLQLCDTRPGCLTLELVGYLERLGAIIGLSIRRAQAEQSLHERTEALRESQRRYRELTEAVQEAHDRLEEKVEQRTAELREAYRQLASENEERKTSETLYRTLVETSPNAVVQTDLSLEIVHASPQAARLHGYASPADMLGMKATELIAPDCREESASHVKSAIQKSEPIAVEFDFLRRDGSRFPGRAVCAPIQNDQGRITGLMGVCQNIEEEKRADEDLRLMARIVEETREGIALVDLDGNILRVNGAFAAMHGYRPEELLGKNLSIFHSPEQMPAVLAANRQIEETGYFDGEVWHIRRDGTPFLALMRNTVMRDEEGQPKYMIGTMVDISERRRLEDATRVQRDLAVALNSAKAVNDGLELCLKAAIEVSGMDGGAIYLVDGESGDVDLAVHSGLPPEFIELVKHYPRTSSRADAVRRGDYIYWCRDTMGLFGDKAATVPDLQSAAILPIHHQGQPIACLNLASQILTEIPTTTRHGLESIAGQIAGAIARLTAEESAQRKQDLIAAVLDHSPAIVYVKDLEGRYQLASQTLAELVQLTLPEIVGKTDYELYAKEAAAMFRENDLRVLEHGRTLQAEEMLVVDGEDRCFLSTKFAVRAPDGTAVLTAGISVDATDRKLAEQRLNMSLQRLTESEAHLKRAQQVSHMGSWHWDIDPDVVHWSEEVFRIFDVDPGSFEPSFAAILTATPSENRSFVQQRVRGILNDDETGSFDQRIVRPCGEVRHIHVQAEVIRDTEGNPIAMEGVVIDVTDRKRAEEALQQAQRLSAIGTLAAGIAHEINHPIGSALRAAETVLATKDVPEKKEIADRCLEEIIRSLERCGDIVRGVLKLSRDDVCERRGLQINDVVRQAADHSRVYAARNDVSIKLDLGDDLPEVPANHLEMELAVSNVLRNALEAEGHSRPIEIRTRLTDDGVQIAVQDWGAGMSKDVRDHLFDPFFTTRQKKGGTGLGASITYGIVQSHNGTIQVESSPGEGTLTTIMLPFTDTVSEQASIEAGAQL